jgi:hypothetical protein
MRLPIYFLLALFFSMPARAQLTVEQLQGVSVSATTLLHVRIRRAGQEFENQDRWEIEFRIGPGGVINASYRHAVSRDGNHIASDDGDFSETIGKPGLFKGMQSLWLLQDNSLLRLIAYSTGGSRTIFTFYPTEGGLKCSVERANALEVGKGNSRLPSMADGYPIEILSTRQVSSNCRATRE